MLKRITLSLLILVSVGVMLPIASSNAHGIRQSVGTTTKKTGRHYRRHSRAWWRRYRARLRRRREARLAALAAHRTAPLSHVLPNNAPGSTAASASLPTLPTGWNGQAMANGGEMKFRTNNGVNAAPGHASLTVVAHSRPTPGYLTAREQKRLLSGVAISDLRRIVIDKMLNSGGWVINDFEREVTGHRVFVVTAHTPAEGESPERSWNFYFTEVQGRIYSLTTNTPSQFADRMGVEAEKFIASLYAAGKIDSEKITAAR